MKHLLTTGLLHSTITFHLKWAEGKQNTAKFLSWAVDFTRKRTPMAQESGWNGGPDTQDKRTSLMITPAGWHHLIPVSIARQFGRTRTRRLWQASWKPPLMASTGEFAEGRLPIQHKGNSKCVWQKVSRHRTASFLPTSNEKQEQKLLLQQLERTTLLSQINAAYWRLDMLQRTLKM